MLRHALPQSQCPATLLNRDANPAPEAPAKNLFEGRRVLVTGAGGSIGSELVRQISKLSPERVYMLDHDESSMHALQLELHGHGLLDDDRVILADIRDGVRISRLMRSVRPDVVLHAAAHKHLPLLERYPAEGVKTNVIGTANVVSAAIKAGVGCFVNVSTDKAARPSSVLGATKRLAEMIVAAYSGGGTRLASVRFGNVLGSRGSLLDSLRFQVQSDRPITVTDERATRFFMTIPEAACLVLEAASMAKHGETYVLDMGEPIAVVDLVRRYLVAVNRPDKPIVYTGLRSGEKLHEELTDAAEQARGTSHSKISRVESTFELPPDFLTRTEGFSARLPLFDDRAIVEALRALLPADVRNGRRMSDVTELRRNAAAREDATRFLASPVIEAAPLSA